jgi:hypothetical protein
MIGKVLPHAGFRREESETGLELLSANKRRSMALANSIVIKDRQTNQNRAQAAIETYSVKSVERIDPRPVPVSHGHHLDVDAVLARSLPKVVGE